MKRPSMRDVAKRAKVSQTTVSHIINNTRFVEETTRQRVLQAIADLGYRPSTAARSLTTNRTETVGVLVPDVSNYFFAAVLRGIESVLTRNNYSIFVCNTTETVEREAYYLNLLLRQRVDGIIATATTDKWDVLTSFEMEHMPIVFVDRFFEGMQGSFVGVDNKKGAYLGTTYLIECAHRKIGISCGLLRLSNMRERLEGFRQALQDHHIPLHDEWVYIGTADPLARREAVKRMLTLPQPPSALFATTNQHYLDILIALKDLGLRCPEDVALVGFDDHPWAVVSDPPLTVVRQPAHQMGEVAAQILLELLGGKTPATARTILDCELIVRQSC